MPECGELYIFSKHSVFMVSLSRLNNWLQHIWQIARTEELYNIRSGTAYSEYVL